MYLHLRNCIIAEVHGETCDVIIDDSGHCVSMDCPPKAVPPNVYILPIKASFEVLWPCHFSHNNLQFLEKSIWLFNKVDLQKSLWKTDMS